MLTLLIAIPILGALLVAFFPGEQTAKFLQRVALLISLGVFILTLMLLAKFDFTTSNQQFVELLNWAEPIGLTYYLGIDGISAPLLALNGFLTCIAIYSTNESINRPRLYYSLILFINAGVTGAFVAQNLLLFVLFYELELIPFYLLIAIWGGPKRGYAATKFLLYTAVSGILILAAFLGMNFLTDASSFNYEDILTAKLSDDTQLILLALLVVGFGIKIPLVPLHTWLPDAYVEASPPVAILLGGILAKLGTYGLVRFGLQLFPDIWMKAAPLLAIIGSVSVIYGALAAIAQKDIKRMVAYSSIGHMGYILVAAAAATPLSLLGAVSQMVSHGLILALLFHLVGIVERKVGTRELDVLNGLMNPIRGLPMVTGLLVLGGMASAGIPGLVGFIAEFMVFQGAFSVFPIPILVCILSSGLTAVYFVILLNRTCFGRLDNKIAYFPKVVWQEKIPALVLAATIFFLGIQPTWLVRWTESTTNAIIATVPSITQVAINK